MSSVIQNILDGVVGEGARSTKFECFINFNDSRLISNEKDVYALVKTSQFPGKSHDVIDMKFKGRNIPIKGQVRYDNTWTCTFYLTQDHELKQALENWIESLDQTHNMKPLSGPIIDAQKRNNSFLGEGYTSTMRIAQLDFDGRNETIVYELAHVFPKSVSAVDVDYSSVGVITEFTVEFSYAYFDSYVVNDGLPNVVEGIKQGIISEIEDLTNNVKSQVASAFSGIADSVSSNLFGDSNATGGQINNKESKSNMISQVDW